MISEEVSNEIGGPRRSLMQPRARPATSVIELPLKGMTAEALEKNYLADELRQVCRAYGVPVSGTKKEMSQRLARKLAMMVGSVGASR